jgi:hypothetical protein
MSERDPFADDVLRRLVASNREYQNEHGYYIVPLAQRLLDTRAELEQAEKNVAALAAALRLLPFPLRNGNQSFVSDFVLHKARAALREATQ